MEQVLSWNLKELLNDGSGGDSNTMTGRTKMFHNACMTLPIKGAEGSQGLLDLMDQFGGFPMISPKSSISGWKFNWLDTVIKMRQLTYSSYPLNVYVYLDDLDSTKYVTFVDESTLGMSDFVLLGDPTSQDLTDYVDYMYYAAKHLRDSRAIIAKTPPEDTPTDEDLWLAIQDVKTFEIALANVSTLVLSNKIL
ncbi:unnamed protein product, partial [Notodromas monacha]